MKRKFFATVMALVVAFSAMFSVSAVAVADYTLPDYVYYADGDTLFVDKLYLGAWCEPEGTDQQLQYFVDCGYNVAYLKHQNGWNGTHLHHNLELYDKYGVKCMIGDCARINGTGWRASFFNLDYSSLLGAYGCDEPLGNGDREYDANGNPIAKFKGRLYQDYKYENEKWVLNDYEDYPYYTVYDYLYYDGMTFLYGADESQFYIDGVTNVGAPAGHEVTPAASTRPSAENTGNYRTGTNSQAYKDLQAAQGIQADDTFQRIFTSVLSNKAVPGAFGYECMKSYCEAVFTGKHDRTISYDDTIPVPVEDRFLEIDIYPYSLNDRTGEIVITEQYLNRLMEYRYFIDAYDIPMTNVYYQNWFVDALLPYIDEGALTQQFYTIMSFGIKGLTVWYYNMYWTDFQTDNEVMVDEWLNRTDLWYYNKAGFDEVKAFDHYYLNFCDPDRWQGIMTINGSQHSTGGEGMFAAITNSPYTFARSTDTYDVFDFEGSTMTPAEAKTHAENYVADHYFTQDNLYQGIESVNATGDATIGIMKDAAGREAYVITNQNFVVDRIENDVAVDFRGATRAMVWLGGEYQLVNLDNGVLNLHLGVGDGAFVIPLA